MTDTAARVMDVIRKGGATASQVASALGVSIPTAYKYLEALRVVYGADVCRERVSARGPKSVVYSMAKNGRSK